jgi:hypothetical protein
MVSVRLDDMVRDGLRPCDVATGLISFPFRAVLVPTTGGTNPSVPKNYVGKTFSLMCIPTQLLTIKHTNQAMPLFIISTGNTPLVNLVFRLYYCMCLHSVLSLSFLFGVSSSVVLGGEIPCAHAGI